MAECHSEKSETKSQLSKYLDKFPEIDEKVLTSIINKFSNHQAMCEEALQAESRRQLYGASTPPGKTGSPAFSPNSDTSSMLIRSNSAGSAGSGSSGRSTPVNSKPTPFIVMTKGDHPSLVPSGMMVQSNGIYYPVVSSGQYMQRTPSPQQISPNTGNGGYFMASPDMTAATMGVCHPSPEYMVPVSNTPTHYVPYLTHGVSTDGGRPMAAMPGAYPDPRHSPGSGPRVMTPNLPSSGAFIPINSAADRTNHGGPAGTNVIGRPSPYRIRTGGISTSSVLQIPPRTPEALDGVSFHGGSTSPRMPLRAGNSGKSDSSPEKLVDEQYTKACLSQQHIRRTKIEKEFQIEQERLKCILDEISERDHDLYIKNYRLAPDPSALDVQSLADEVRYLNIAVNEVSNRIDKIDNHGPMPSDVNPTIRIVSHKPREHAAKFDRSESMPNPNASPFSPGDQKPALQRPLSEHNLPAVDFDLSSLSDQELEGWSMINTSPIRKKPIKKPITDHVNNVQANQWRCAHCTFDNHEDMRTCEICHKDR